MSNNKKKPPMIKVLVTVDVHYDVRQNYDVTDEPHNNVDQTDSINQIELAKQGYFSFFITKWY